IGARLVSTNRHQILIFATNRQDLTYRFRHQHMFFSGDLRHHTADRFLDINRRVMTRVCHFTRQNNVTIENGTRRISDRVLQIVTFG
ncbi:hypothetical protein D027_2268B, partial [Vibrio parahaemolyticus 861]